MSKDDRPATRSDVEEIVTQAVSGATKEILSAVGEQFDVVNDRLDNVEATTGRIETRFENVDRKLGEHEVRIDKLERKTV